MKRQRSFQTTQRSYGQLFLIPTPIGNLEDMTFRAVRLLKEVDLILAEDTRQTIKLLNHYDIKTKMKSFHEHSSPHQVSALIEQLLNGESIGLVSDAGMPLINDPGHPLVQSALKENINVISLPGANAALTGLIASGLSAEQFTYYGFFPKNKKERTNVLELVNQRSETAIFYESPYRIKEALRLIKQHLGSNRRIVIARELTKKYEEYIRSTVSEVLAILEEENIKGELVLLIEGSQPTKPEKSTLPYKKHVEFIMDSENLSAKEAIKKVAKQRHVKKQTVYQAYHGLIGEE